MSVDTILLATIDGTALFNYMIQRESIRRRKEAGEPAPWTDDPILREYSFTNVRRSDDRTTRELMTNFYLPNVAGARPGDVLFNCAMARWFGRANVVAHIGWQIDWNAHTTIARVRQWNGPVFTAAYVITNNGQSADKVELVCRQILQRVWDARHRIAEAALRENGWRYLVGQLRELPGFGGTGFMAKEVAQDFMLSMS